MQTIKFYLVGFVFQILGKGYFAKCDDGEVIFVYE